MTCEFKLLTKPTQFVSGKTEDTLCDIIKRVEELNLINDNEINNNNEISEHIIDAHYFCGYFGILLYDDPRHTLLAHIGGLIEISTVLPY